MCGFSADPNHVKTTLLDHGFGNESFTLRASPVMILNMKIRTFVIEVIVYKTTLYIIYNYEKSVHI